jgi:hypothetical protein
MRAYVGFDDTDTTGTKRGTGRLARMFEDVLPAHVRLVGVVRQQLPTIPGIPFTSHNSSACVILDIPDRSDAGLLTDLAARHIKNLYVEGSDPGLCVAGEWSDAIPLMEFGRTCCSRIVTQREAIEAGAGVHVSGHGGTNDGIIGAVAGVGLTMLGWSGRFIEYGRLRDFPKVVSAGELERHGIRIWADGRDAMVPSLDDPIQTGGWLRPRLIAGCPVVVIERDCQEWHIVGKKTDTQPSAEKK